MDNSKSSFEWEEIPDITSFSEEEIRARLEAFTIEEREISYRRRVLQGRIDLLRAELVHRGGLSASPNELARVLLGDSFSDNPSNVPTREESGETSGAGRGGE